MAGTSLNPVVSNSFVKQYLGLNQSTGETTSHTAYFKKQRELTIGRYVVQTNKVLITLDKLISFDPSTVNDELKRDGNSVIIVIASSSVLSQKIVETYFSRFISLRDLRIYF